MNRKYKAIFSIIIIVGLVFSLYYLSKWISAATGRTVYNLEYENKKKCLFQSNIYLYSSKSCADCLEQEKILGDLIYSINYIDCKEKILQCAEIESLPAWKIQDKVYYGKKNLSELIRLSNC
jgi:hypothetical protein